MSCVILNIIYKQRKYKLITDTMEPGLAETALSVLIDTLFHYSNPLLGLQPHLTSSPTRVP